MLYKLNTFCVKSIVVTRLPTPDLDSRWIMSMSTTYRNMITNLEIRLALPGEYPLYAYTNMQGLFPGLRTLILFFDRKAERYWRNRADILTNSETDLAKFVSFYQSLKPLLPYCEQTSLDTSVLMLKDDEHPLLKRKIINKQLITAVTETWGKPDGEKTIIRDGRSAFVTQELEHRKRYHDQGKAVFNHIKAEKVVARQWRNHDLEYTTTLRSLPSHGNLTDDDTDDEIRYFDDWDLERDAAANKAWMGTALQNKAWMGTALEARMGAALESFYAAGLH